MSDFADTLHQALLTAALDHLAGLTLHMIPVPEAAPTTFAYRAPLNSSGDTMYLAVGRSGAEHSTLTIVNPNTCRCTQGDPGVILDLYCVQNGVISAVGRRREGHDTVEALPGWAAWFADARAKALAAAGQPFVLGRETAALTAPDDANAVAAFIAAKLASANKAALLMLPYLHFAKMTGLSAASPVLHQALAALTEQGVLAQHWRFYHSDGRDWDVEGEELEEARAEGTVVDPDSGTLTPITSENLLPYWSAA